MRGHATYYIIIHGSVSQCYCLVSTYLLMKNLITMKVQVSWQEGRKEGRKYACITSPLKTDCLLAKIRRSFMTELLTPVNCLYFSELHTHAVMPSRSTDFG